jgi:hypothetical protein
VKTCGRRSRCGDPAHGTTHGVFTMHAVCGNNFLFFVMVPSDAKYVARLDRGAPIIGSVSHVHLRVLKVINISKNIKYFY